MVSVLLINKQKLEQRPGCAADECSVTAGQLQVAGVTATLQHVDNER